MEKQFIYTEISIQNHLKYDEKILSEIEFLNNRNLRTTQHCVQQRFTFHAGFSGYVTFII